MRAAEDIAVTAETILALAIDGLPTSARALRRLANAEAWPVVFDANRKYLFLVDAIPDPWGGAIQRCLARRTCVSDPTFPPTSEDGRVWAGRRPGWELTEARLAILFEVFRREFYVSRTEAIDTLAREASQGALPAHLQRAVAVAVRRGKRKRNDYFSRTVNERDVGVLEATYRPEPPAEHLGTSSISRSTIMKWIEYFIKYGVFGLNPVDLSERLHAEERTNGYLGRPKGGTR